MTAKYHGDLRYLIHTLRSAEFGGTESVGRL